MTGIALEGGAERSSFTAGVLDWLMEQGFPASAVSGTSAGAGCAMNYCSGQCGISLEMMKVPKEERYFGLRHMAHTGRFVDLDFMVRRYAEQLDFGSYFSSAVSVDFTATCCETGAPVYLTNEGSKEQTLAALKASCSLPIICKPVEIDGWHYVDGSIADPIPFQHLLEQGCEKVLVILTGPSDCHPTDYRKFKPLLLGCYRKRYPALYHAIVHRISRYEESVQRMAAAERAGRVFVLRPQVQAIPLFTQNPEQIEGYYQHGKQLAMQCWQEICQWLEAEPITMETAALKLAEHYSEQATFSEEVLSAGVVR